MRKLAVLIAALSLLSASAQAAGAGGVPPFPKVPGKWSHVEINETIAHKAHTLILDRGRITQSSTSQITLRESDGSVWTIPVTTRTIVTLNNARSTIYVLGKRMNVVVMRIDGGAAVRIRATT